MVLIFGNCREFAIVWPLDYLRIIYANKPTTLDELEFKVGEPISGIILESSKIEPITWSTELPPMILGIEQRYSAFCCQNLTTSIYLSYVIKNTVLRCYVIQPTKRWKLWRKIFATGLPNGDRWLFVRPDRSKFGKHVITVNGYRAMLVHCLWPELGNIDMSELWFQRTALNSIKVTQRSKLWRKKNSQQCHLTASVGHLFIAIVRFDRPHLFFLWLRQVHSLRKQDNHFRQAEGLIYYTEWYSIWPSWNSSAFLPQITPHFFHLYWNIYKITIYILFV